MRSFIKKSGWRTDPKLIEERKRAKEIIGRDFFDFGWGNGYVVIPGDSPLWGMHYDRIEVEVHGGLTFSEPADGLDWDEIEPEDAGGWVVGFDTAHYGDSLDTWPWQRVRAEAHRLRRQLQKLERELSDKLTKSILSGNVHQVEQKGETKD